MHLLLNLQYRQKNVEPIIEKRGYGIQPNVELSPIDYPPSISEPVLCAVGILNIKKQIFAIECLQSHTIDRPLTKKKYALSESVVFYKNSRMIMAGGFVNNKFLDEV